MPKPNLKAVALKALEHVAPGKGEHYVGHLKKDEGFKMIPLGLLRPNPSQPRKLFDKESLHDLTASVKEKGVLQPILVRKDPESEGFVIIAGERRYRAAEAAGLSEIPALIRTHEDHEEVALIENLQRENLTALEEAEALLRLKTTKDYTDLELARVVGKSRQAINDSLRLNDLPDPIKDECRTCGIGTKRQLLQVLRAGSPEKMATAWEGLKTGEVATVRELKQQTAPPKKGRPKHYRFAYEPDDAKYHVLVTFAKKSASQAEVRNALKAAVKSLPKLHA